jgi:NB-ARC domain
LNDDFKTINRLKKLSRAVDNEEGVIRLRTDTEKNTELLAAMDLMKDGKADKEKLPCYYISFGRDEKFYGREEILRRIKNALDPIDGDERCRAFALHGMGGVGKTKIALQCVNSSRSKFDAIFWISADNSIKLTQSFLEISRRLGLSPENDDA